MTDDEGLQISRLLQQRCDALTEATLSGGRVILIHNIAWGRDIGARFDHFTTNVSPPSEGSHTVDFFYAEEVEQLVAVETGALLFKAQ